jgi:hypothetical protein
LRALRVDRLVELDKRSLAAPTSPTSINRSGRSRESFRYTRLTAPDDRCVWSSPCRNRGGREPESRAASQVPSAPMQGEKRDILLSFGG